MFSHLSCLAYFLTLLNVGLIILAMFMNEIRENTTFSTSIVYCRLLINVGPFLFSIKVTLLDIVKESYLRQMEPKENYH